MRNTLAKTEILNLINQSDMTLSHSEIQALLPDGLCNRVTIYRVLDRLTDEGLVHKIININGVVKYASCQSCVKGHQHNHVHFSCEKCMSVTCLKDIEPSFNFPKAYRVNQVNFMLSGLCPNCS